MSFVGPRCPTPTYDDDTPDETQDTRHKTQDDAIARLDKTRQDLSSWTTTVRFTLVLVTGGGGGKKKLNSSVTPIRIST